MIQRITSFLRHFRRGEDGTATIEFAILFPAFIVLFVSAFELGILMTRQALLERAVDMTIREIQINTTSRPTHDDVRNMICARASLIPDCVARTKVEMIQIDPRVAKAISPQPDCIDTGAPFKPVREFRNGSENEMMLIRVCSLFDPIFPTTGLGFQLPRESGNLYALIATSAFVMEPL